jgi:hypothetical protein
LAVTVTVTAGGQEAPLAPAPGEPPAGEVVGNKVMVSVVVEVVERVVVDETDDDDETALIFYQDVSTQETLIRSFPWNLRIGT